MSWASRARRGLDLDTLEARLSAEIAERDAVITSLLVSAWARKPSA